MAPLVDTSVLIDYFGGATTPEADLLDALLGEGVAPSTAPVIVQEFLQGFWTQRDLQRAAEYLSLFDRFPPPGYDVHEEAAALYRTLRRRGFTGSTVDCLIVAIARRWGVALLTSDDIQRRLAVAAAVPLWVS